ncbi:uncharacterized protein LAESUDRAFT_764742 [Laetiporus sulphureus 93-53]|uniref:Choline/carnitine acyltransferase domain-containing protein n=1 Tax=Laetiporus sulphureus 93-53 TaxID=1314785 RepID=A0A165B612_9APHY|nr:uncharacterized protein LAESUDRAFT_764742 [Laetiporus sulphureus 93-53]KZT00319.1 hypothetical protein LAESUDRAFT_764742 [Laetiporus sulphureus 93-53]
MFVLYLDMEGAPDFIVHSRLLWHGAVIKPAGKISTAENLGMCNRWMDKPLQSVVVDDGKAGFVGEHSIMDGTLTVSLCDCMLNTIATPRFASSTSTSVTSPMATPTPLDWHISAKTQRGIVHMAGYIFGADCNTEHGVHTMARGEGGGTYEAASTQQFLEGQTEAIRVMSWEADEWVESMDDVRVGVREREELFGRVVEVHGQMARMAGKGRGVDRHLLGLKKAEMANEQFCEELKRAAQDMFDLHAVLAKEKAAELVKARFD